jgi:hypothetical protein
MSLKSYGQWLFEQHQAGKPTNVPPPLDVEPRDVWFRRIRGNLSEAPQGSSGQTPRVVAAIGPTPPPAAASYLRRPVVPKMSG